MALGGSTAPTAPAPRRPRRRGKLGQWDPSNAGEQTLICHVSNNHGFFAARSGQSITWIALPRKGTPSHLYFIRPAGRGVMLAKAGVEKAVLPKGLHKPLFFRLI